MWGYEDPADASGGHHHHSEVYMKMGRRFAGVLFGAVAATALAGGLTACSRASAQLPAMTVYKTPT